MIFVNPVVDENTAIDFYAGNGRSYLQLLPLWRALNNRQGVFFVSRHVQNVDEKVSRLGLEKESSCPIVIASYKDLNDIFIQCNNRPIIMYEEEHTQETRGLLNIVSLFICKDQRTALFRKGYRGEIYKVNDATEAIEIIFKFCKGKEVKHITHIEGKSVGLIYMIWGEKALQATRRSLATLRFLGYSYPVALVGDFPNKIKEHDLTDKFTIIQCNTNPFDASKANNFQFRAGRVKPQLCDLTPFDLNLYLDADTRFIQPIQGTFEMLLDNDLLVTEELLSLKDLYNKKLAGWELNLLERATTIIELQNDEDQKFINSGVIFFKKNNATLRLFADWYNEWMRFQEWDEQLALMRAIDRNRNLKIKRLSVEWNSPHLKNETIIFHNYGRGEVRMNGK